MKIEPTKIETPLSRRLEAMIGKDNPKFLEVSVDDWFELAGNRQGCRIPFRDCSHCQNEVYLTVKGIPVVRDDWDEEKRADVIGVVAAIKAGVL